MEVVELWLHPGVIDVFRCTGALLEVNFSLNAWADMKGVDR